MYPKKKYPIKPKTIPTEYLVIEVSKGKNSEVAEIIIENHAKLPLFSAVPPTRNDIVKPIAIRLQITPCEVGKPSPMFPQLKL